MLYHSWISGYVACFTIHGLVGIWHARPFIDWLVCGMLYHSWTSRYVACSTIYRLVGMWHALPFMD